LAAAVTATITIIPTTTSTTTITTILAMHHPTQSLIPGSKTPA
jgi:hypothetical protein